MFFILDIVAIYKNCKQRYYFQTVKAFLPAMMEKNRGHIVSIASLAGHIGVPKLVDYCASKFAAVGFDEALRMELEVIHLYLF